MKISINERLRELRIKSGYTQSQIAKILNIDRSTYSYYEIGKTMPDLSALMTLAKIFNISLGELLADETKHAAIADSGAKNEFFEGKKNSSHIYELSRDEKELIGMFRSFPEEQQKKVLESLRSSSSKKPSQH
jgi:transcriptional regulator with XRE-family HTH domain